MTKFFVNLISLLLISTAATSLQAVSEKRTDGPPGSEYGDFSAWEGQFQIGGRFGASLLSNGDKTSFMVGADFDYRPFDLFGFRLSYEQALQKPRFSLIQLTPLIHTEFSNLRPYIFFGPGLAIASEADKKLKFSIAGGIGGDFMLMEKLGFGMLWTYYTLFDSVDVHTIGARISYWF